MHNNKLHIEIFILVFMFTVMILCILFSIYYISPNNYLLFEYNDNNNKLISSKEYTIDINKQLKLKYSKYKNKKIKILNEQMDCIPVIFENKFKSDNIYISKNKLVKLVNSDLVIKNNLTLPIKIIISIYS